MVLVVNGKGRLGAFSASWRRVARFRRSSYRHYLPCRRRRNLSQNFQADKQGVLGPLAVTLVLPYVDSPSPHHVLVLGPLRQLFIMKDPPPEAFKLGQGSACWASDLQAILSQGSPDEMKLLGCSSLCGLEPQ